MLDGQKVLAILPARGGSKGLPGKNTRDCAGQPLLAWSVLAARESECVDRLVVSSDDPEILAAACALGAPALARPPELATDGALLDGVVLQVEDALAKEGERFSIGVLLQPTSPLRLAEDIDGALRTMVDRGFKSLASVTDPAKSPYWMHAIGPDGRLVSLFDGAEAARRRQELPKAYVLNGAIFAFDLDWFRAHRKFVCAETGAFWMPPERSIDIDTALDLEIASLLLSRRAASAAPRERR